MSHRTGREKPNPSHNRSERTSDKRREVVCEHGHTFWSTHIDGERLPLPTERPDEC